MKRLNLPAWASALLLVALIVLPGVTLLPRLQVNNAPEIYMPAQAPSVVLERELRRQFPNDQVLVALFEGEQLFAAPFLASMDKVIQVLEAHPKVERVLTVTNLEHIAASPEGFTVEPLVDLRALDKTTAEQRRQRAVADRFARGLLVARDGSALALLIRPLPLEDSVQRLDLETTLRQAIAAAGLSGSLTAVAGQIAVDVAQMNSMLRDNQRFTPIIVILGWVLIWLMFRRILPVVLGGLAMAAASGLTLSLLVLIDQPFTLVSTLLPSLISALTLALLIHFYSALASFAQRGLQGEQRVSRALDSIRRPARFTTLTTVAGLVSLGFNPIPPIAVYGLVGAAGMVMAHGIVVGLLPPMFRRWDKRPWPKSRSGMEWVGRLVDKLTVVGIRRSWTVIAVTTVVLAAGLPLLWQVRAETDLFRFFAADHPIIESTRRMETKLSGVTSLQVVFEGEGRNALVEPQRLRAIQAFQTWAEALPQVDRALSMVDIVEEMNWAFHGEDPAWRRLPDERALVSQYLLIYDGRDLYDLVNRDLQRALVNLSVNVHPAREITEVMENIQRYLEGADLAGLKWQIGGFGRWFADQHELLVIGQVRSLWSALAMIFIFMWVLWRSAWSAALCMVPNIAPLLVVFMIMGLFGIWLDMATVLIASIAAGIVVDDTIHFYYNYSRHQAGGARPVWALARTYHHAGRAAVATTFVLSAQFLLLTTSQFKPIVLFGLLTAIGLMAGIVFDLVFFPALLAVLAGVRGRLVRARP